MEVLWFLTAYILSVLMLLFVLVFGQHPWFEGTPIEHAHWCATQRLPQGIRSARSYNRLLILPRTDLHANINNCLQVACQKLLRQEWGAVS